MNEFTLDLKNLLRLAFSQPLTWLFGEPQEDTPVHWVATSPDEVQPGDILLLSAGRYDRVSLVRARERGAAAVLLLGEARISWDEEAFPAGLPVAAVSGEIGLLMTCEELLYCLPLLMTAFKMCGAIILPSFATAATDIVIWIGVGMVVLSCPDFGWCGTTLGWSGMEWGGVGPVV